MIALLASLALQAAVPGLGTLPRQELPARGCAAYLWAVGDGRLVAVASADPATLRLALDGAAPVDLVRASQRGEGGYGLAATTDYRGGDVTATLSLTIATRADLRDGAAVTAASLDVERPGRDGLLVPLAGLIGCRP